MSCKYMDECPFADRQCRANIADCNKIKHKCVPFLVTAYENAKKELQEYKDTGFTADKIREASRLYAEQAEELKAYKRVGSYCGITSDDIFAARMTAVYEE